MSLTHPPLTIQQQIELKMHDITAAMACGGGLANSDMDLRKLAAMVYRDCLEIVKTCQSQDGLALAASIRQRITKWDSGGQDA